MEDEPASEAIDKDLDSEDEPDSMDLLMGEIEMPYEAHCNTVSYKTTIKQTDLLIHNKLNYSHGIKDNVIIKSNKDHDDKQFVNVKSLKECQGYAKILADRDTSREALGFIHNGELRRTTDGVDPINIPHKVIFSILLSRKIFTTYIIHINIGRIYYIDNFFLLFSGK